VRVGVARPLAEGVGVEGFDITVCEGVEEGGGELLGMAEALAAALWDDVEVPVRDPAVLCGVAEEVPHEERVAAPLAVSEGAAVVVPVAAEEAVVEEESVEVVLTVSDSVPVGELEVEAAGDALAVPLEVDEADPVWVGSPVADAVALMVAVSVGLVQRNKRWSHTKLGAHAGAPSSLVHAGPSETPPGHQAPSAPQPGGATTALRENEANVNAVDGAHIAGDAPWQDSDDALHWRPASHKVAMRGPA
jgi:hypothetical protein